MKRKYYCIDCKVKEIEEPEYCCTGTACSCMGKPIEPPLCESCFDKMIKKMEEEYEKKEN